MTTLIWLSVSEVIVCNEKMINVDDGESAQVTCFTPRLGGRGRPAPGVPGGHIIEASANDEIFVVNGEIFKAETYFSGFERGYRVRFLSDSVSGACASATILNMRSGKACEVWCE